MSILYSSAAFSTSNPKNDGKLLDVMEKDIERKVNDLASSLYEQNNKKTLTGENKSVDVVIQDTDNSSTPEKQAVDQDVIIKIDDPVTKGGSVKSTPAVHSTQVQNTNKPAFFSEKGLKTANSLAFAKNRVSSNVVKGSPKLVNERYAIIARTFLATPDGNKEKRQNRMMESNGEAPAFKHNHIITNNQSQNRRLQTKLQNMKQLFGNLGQSVHISNDGSSSNTSARIHRDGQPYFSSVMNNNIKKLKQNATKLLFQYKPRQRLNRTLATNGRPVVCK